jgi:hypothetical protein
MENKWIEERVPRRVFKLRLTRMRPIRLYRTRQFSQQKANEILEGKIEGKNKSVQTSHASTCINWK